MRDILILAVLTKLLTILCLFTNLGYFSFIVFM
jgi:hypothetical protein